MIKKSLDYSAGAKEGHKIKVRKGIFEELDRMRERYDGLDALMSERVLELKDDIRLMPLFMRKVKMMMIPSVGYFTVVSKCDKEYIEYLNEALQAHQSLRDCKDEDKILDILLGELMTELGWKICFQSETDIYLQNRLTKDLDLT